MRFLPLLVLVSSFSFGQKTDSLLNAFKAAGHDTTRLHVLDLILESQSSDYVAIEKYSLQMQDLSKTNAETSSGKLKDIYLHYYATALNNLAYVEENKSNNPAAVGKYQSALRIFQENNDKKGEAMVLTNLGFVSKKTGDLAGAVKYYEASMKINREVNNKLGLYASLNNLGLAFNTLGEVKKALANYFEALKVAEEMNDKRRQARVLNNIAGVYFAQGEIKLHREYLEKALVIAVESGEKRGEASILNNLAHELVKSGEYETARKYSERVYELAKELSDQSLLAIALSDLAVVSQGNGKFDEAIKFEKESLGIRRNMDNKFEAIGSLNSLGLTYIKFKKYDDAIASLTEALDLSKSVGNANGISRATKYLSDAYKLKGNPAKALEYYEAHIMMRDSVSNEENRKATFKSQYKYEYEIRATADSIRALGEKQVLNAQLSQEKSQRYALIAAIILGFTLAAFAFYRFRVKQQMKELQLRNRIASDLHDEVGSAISSISLFAGIAKMKSNENDEIMAKIENTSRETVDKMGDIVWSIEPSNDRFDNVLKKMNYFGDQLMGSLGIKFNFDVENGIEKSTFDMAKRKNIYLIYKEAINNAAKYSGARNVNVALSKEGRQYEMEISDDGRGFDMTSSTMGNGLRNMKRRAKEMNGVLKIDSSDTGTVITLTV
jgi:two-component system sensor histidine kinase UhpB